MAPYKDLTGKKFNRLTVLGFKEFNKNGTSIWRCLCECGTIKDINVGWLRKTISCGCFFKEQLIKRNKTHGKSETKEYNSWRQIKQRCYNPRNNSYHDYGDRGIRVCDRWLNSFENFYKDMGKCPDECDGVDRIDNNGNYCPSNCKWSTSLENAQNKRNSLIIEYGGKSYTCSALARKLNINKSTLRYRYLNGINVDFNLERIKKCQ